MQAMKEKARIGKKDSVMAPSLKPPPLAELPGGRAGARAALPPAAQGVCLALSRNGEEGTHTGSLA